jgi:hypothetical protein
MKKKLGIWAMAGYITLAGAFGAVKGYASNFKSHCDTYLEEAITAYTQGDKEKFFEGANNYCRCLQTQSKKIDKVLEKASNLNTDNVTKGLATLLKKTNSPQGPKVTKTTSAKGIQYKVKF